MHTQPRQPSRTTTRAVSKPSKRWLAASSLLLMGAALFYVQAADAQQLYRQVGPDGRITYTDKPPTGPEPAAPRAARSAGTGTGTGAGTGAAAPAATGGALPYELRQVANRYPVTLYTGENCVPCGSARAMLSSRGVPFTEKTVSSNEDIQSLQRLSGDSSLPFATIGGQQLKGYSETEWTQFIDAAGYPKQSQLPRSYRNPAATPLVARATAQAPAAPQAAANPSAAPDPSAAPAAPAVSPTPTPNNPAGIRF